MIAIMVARKRTAWKEDCLVDLDSTAQWASQVEMDEIA